MIEHDQLGRTHATADALASMLYQHPALDPSRVMVDDPVTYNSACRKYFLDWPELKAYAPSTQTVEEFDTSNQSQWHMPQQYRDLDVAQWVLERCTCEAELQRVGEELLLYQERDAFDLLRYMIYLVDTMRDNNIVWGVGRGSSVASFVLYIIGVHRINSLAYDLDPREFLK
jgi:hypothetical protein